jgi:hypothetical protein
MLTSLGHDRPKLANTDHRRALQNPAVAHCQKSWERAFRSVYKITDSKAVGLFEAAVAFREAMPLLVGRKNISDFVACVTYGLENLILMEDTATKLLYAAQVASNLGSPRIKKAKNAPKSAPKQHVSNPLDQKSALLPSPSPMEN